MENTKPLAELVKAKARILGFDLVGITGAEPSVFSAEYRDWIAQGYAGEMDYLARNLERRLDPRTLLPDARSIIAVGMNYYTAGATDDATEVFNQISGQNNEETANLEFPNEKFSNEGVDATARDPAEDIASREGAENKLAKAAFARYALGDDYHEVMTARLRELLAFVKEQAGEGADGRVYVDTGPILEREVARRAGLGWFGKNTMLINTRRGSYFFLGEIITNIALESDTPALGGCGTCTRCLDACPTGALLEPYTLDARRCLSYLTIELKGAIPDEFRPALAQAGNRIYGCDICQEVCPFNERRSVPTTEPAFAPRKITSQSGLVDLLLLTEEQFRQQFKGSPVKRAKRRGLLRNAAIALAASDEPNAESALRQAAANDPEPLVREHADWALQQIHARQLLRQ